MVGLSLNAFLASVLLSGAEIWSACFMQYINNQDTNLKVIAAQDCSLYTMWPKVCGQQTITPHPYVSLSPNSHYKVGSTQLYMIGCSITIFSLQPLPAWWCTKRAPWKHGLPRVQRKSSIVLHRALTLTKPHWHETKIILEGLLS